MALEVLSDISAALSQTFERDLYHQFNRTATLLSQIEARPTTTGKTIAWDVEVTGSGTQATVVAEGSDVAAGEYQTDKPLPATLSHGIYRTAFQLSETELKVAAISMGSPEALVDLLGDRMLTKMASLASLINQDLFTGTGTSGGNPNIIGLYGGACDASTTYATIIPGTYTEWQSTVLGNSSVDRPLTVDLLNQAEEQIFRKCGRRPDFIMTSTGVRRKYQGLFEEIRRLQGGPYNLGVEGDPAFMGIPVQRDKDAPSKKLIMGCSEFLRIRFLPPLGNDIDTTLRRMRMLQGSNGQPAQRVTGTAIPVGIQPAGKTGANIKFWMDLELQLQVLRRNAFAVITDISET